MLLSFYKNLQSHSNRVRDECDRTELEMTFTEKEKPNNNWASMPEVGIMCFLRALTSPLSDVVIRNTIISGYFFKNVESQKAPDSENHPCAN